MVSKISFKIVVGCVLLLLPIAVFLLLKNDPGEFIYPRNTLYKESTDAKSIGEETCKTYEKDSLAVINKWVIREWEKGNYEKALSIGQCAYNRAVRENNRKELASTLNSLGLIHWRLENNKDAMVAYAEAANIAKELKLYRLLGLTYTNQTLILKEQKQYAEALTFNQKAIKIFKDNEFYRELGIAYNNNGQIYKNQGNLKEAELNYNKAISSYEKQEYKDGLAATYYNLADIYSKSQRGKDAIEYGQLSLKIALEINRDVRVKDAYFKLSEIYEQVGEVDAAFYNYKKFSELNTKILNANQSKILANSQAEMGAEIKDLKIHNLQKNKEITTNRTVIISIGLYIIILIGIIIGLRYTSKIKLKNKEISVKLKASNEILEIKENELRSYMLDVTKKNEMISNLQNVEAVDISKTNKKSIEIEKLSKNKILTVRDWAVFKEKFETIYPNFFTYLDENEIRFTEGEIRFMVLLKLKLTSNEMANILGISPQSVRVSKMRLKKKLAAHYFRSVEDFLSFIKI